MVRFLRHKNSYNIFWWIRFAKKLFTYFESKVISSSNESLEISLAEGLLKEWVLSLGWVRDSIIHHCSDAIAVITLQTQIWFEMEWSHGCVLCFVSRSECYTSGKQSHMRFVSMLFKLDQLMKINTPLLKILIYRCTATK